MAVIRTWLRTALAQSRAWSGRTVAVVGLVIATLVLLPLRTHLSVATVGLLFLLPVVVTAVVGDLWSSLLAVVAANLLVNFFFIPPYHTFLVQSGADLVLLFVSLLVALAISIAVDVAVRYRTTADQLADQADRLADIDRLRTALLAAVSHDLRTPLAGIKAAVSTLRQPDVDIPTPAREELLATVEESTDRLTDLVDNLMSASRLQAGELSVRTQPIALDGVAAAALVATGAEAVLDIPDDLPLVLADPALLEHVIINLVRNAQTADRVWPVRLTGHVNDDRAELAVIDRGPGADEGDWQRMFVPFQRLGDHTAPHGLGLGLTVVKGFTEAMGGSVTPSPTPGGWAHHDRVPAPRRTADHRGGGMTRVLVVDDDPQLLRAMRINLTAHGYQVELAATGNQALVAAGNHPPDLVIVDLGLPDINGVAVVTGLRGWSQAPILVLSARGDEHAKIAALDAGADDYVTKPFGMGELAARLRAVLRRHGAPTDPAIHTESFTVDLAARRVTTPAGQVRLTPTEWHLLEILARNPGKLITQRHLLTEVWGPAYTTETHYLRVHLANLRRKLEPDPAHPRHLVTEPGQGYRFHP